VTFVFLGCFSLRQEYKGDVILFLRSEGVRQDTVSTLTLQNFCRQHINFTREKGEDDIHLDKKNKQTNKVNSHYIMA